jgi:hypothetical protein
MMRFKLTAIGALALIPSLAVAQQTTSDTTMRDTTMRDTTYTTTSEGSLAAPSANLGLTSDQVKELQKAINDNGCHAGEVTGTITDETREGIQCIREAKNIEGTNINDVLTALGLSFTVDSTQSGNAMSDTISSDTTDTTMKSDTTFQTDSGALQRDTSTVPYDTSAVRDTTMMQDTTTLPDTSSMPRDTTMFQNDTTSMTRDSMPSTMPSMPSTPPTTTTLPDTSRSTLKP